MNRGGHHKPGHPWRMFTIKRKEESSVRNIGGVRSIVSSESQVARRRDILTHRLSSKEIIDNERLVTL